MKGNSILLAICSACLLFWSCDNGKKTVTGDEPGRQDELSGQEKEPDPVDIECINGTVNAGKCQCAEGWRGAKCNECAEGYIGKDCQKCPACGAGGTCIINNNGQTACECRDNFVGELCDDCNSDHWGEDCNPCPNCAYGHCNAGIHGDGKCICDGNWSGDYCFICTGAIIGDDCVECPCGEHGDCQEVEGDPELKCICHYGWAGATCNICDTNFYGPECNQICPSCGWDGICNSGLEGDGSCICPDNYAGIGCSDCKDNFYGRGCASCPVCGEHGSCSDGATGDGSCLCEDGWGGDYCNEPLKALNESCQADNECRSGLICDYTLKTCQPACISGSTDCSPGLSCVKGHCTSCPENFTGPTCSDCAEGYYGSNCLSCGCVTSRGKCRDGRDGDGKCEPGSCIFGYTGENCDQCTTGFTGFGNCEDCAEGYYGPACQPCNCGNDKSCVDGKDGTGECRCKNGATVTIADKDNNSYTAICINKIYWTQKNIKSQTGVKCYANTKKDTNFINNYGCLYTRADALKVCPDGWRLPTNDEYQEQLVRYIWDTEGKDQIYQSLMANSAAWGDLYSSITNKYGFSAMPAGYYDHDPYNDIFDDYDDSVDYKDYGSAAYFWTSDVNTNNLPATGFVKSSMNNGQSVQWNSASHVQAFSVRCVKAGL